MHNMVWMDKAPGVWKTTIGNPQGMTPLKWMAREPLLEGLQQIGNTSLPFQFDDIEWEEKENSQVVRLPLQDDEQVYGLGLQFLKMNQRGRTRYLRINSDPKQDTGETHAPVPFFLTDRGYGLLIDTARIITAHIGSTVRLQDVRRDKIRDRNEVDGGWKSTVDSEYIELVLPKEGADLYLFGGPGRMEVVRRYNLFCGGGVLPPKWGLGFWHRVPTLFNDQQVIDEAMQFRERDFPCDVIGLEPGWHSKSYPVTYEWSAERFPNPEKAVSTLKENGFQVNLWEHPYVSPDSSLYESLLEYAGSHSVWLGAVPDYTIPEAREAYMKQHLDQHIRIGVSGYKLDECDGSELTGSSWMFPAHASFPSGYDGEQMRQLYGLLFQKMGDEMFREENRRTYGLVRASNAGASSLPYVLYSDLYDHRQFIRALCNSSFSGLLWTPEVRNASTAEEWVRRMQAVCFSPLAMLNAWGDGTKPWTFPEVESVIRHYIQLRMMLLPYFYNAFAQYRYQGIPPFRAMPLVMESTNMQNSTTSNVVLNTTDGAYGKETGRLCDDQYMIGDSLLVAPMFAGQTVREVLLPTGTWFGLESGQRYQGGQLVQVEPGLERIPLFVREGSIIPVVKPAAHAPRKGEQAVLHLIHFGQQPGELQLYDDDGETFDYEKGAFSWTSFKVERTSDGSFRGSCEGQPQFYSYSEVKWHLNADRLPDDLA